MSKADTKSAADWKKSLATRGHAHRLAETVEVRGRNEQRYEVEVWEQLGTGRFTARVFEVHIEPPYGAPEQRPVREASNLSPCASVGECVTNACALLVLIPPKGMISEAEDLLELADADDE